jgi:general secretion pathway protein D
MAERQRFVEEFYGQVPGYDVPIDFGRKPGPLAKMNQIVMREEMKIENGGPGLPGETVYRPGQLGPGAPRQPVPQGQQVPPTAPGDIARDLIQSQQPAPTPAPTPVGPLGPGGTTAPAPEPVEPPPPAVNPPPPAQTTPTPPSDERLQVQPR